MALAEEELGFPLHPLHARLLLEIADGGFGPGYGLYGVGPEGHADPDLGGTLAGVRRTLAGEDGSDLTPGSVPLVDFGGGCWALVDATSGRGTVLTLTAGGVYETEYELRSWFRAWLDGIDIYATLFDQARAPRWQGINPFTKEPMEYVGQGPVRGKLLLAQRPV